MYFEGSIAVVIINLALWGLDALPHFYEKFIHVILEQLSCPFVSGVKGLVLFNIDENESNMLDDCENEVLTAVIPIFSHFFPQVKLSRLGVDHGVIDFADEHHFGGFSGELLESDFELKLCVFVESVPDEKDPVPNWIKRKGLSKESSWGMM